MKGKTVMLLVLATLALGFMLGIVVSFKISEPEEDLKQQIYNLESKIKMRTKENQRLEEKYQKLKKSLPQDLETGKEGTIKELQEYLANKQSEIERLKNNVTTLQTDLNNLMFELIFSSQGWLIRIGSRFWPFDRDEYSEMLREVLLVLKQNVTTSENIKNFSPLVALLIKGAEEKGGKKSDIKLPVNLKLLYLFSKIALLDGSIDSFDILTVRKFLKENLKLDDKFTQFGITVFKSGDKFIMDISTLSQYINIQNRYPVYNTVRRLINSDERISPAEAQVISILKEKLFH